MSTSRSSSSLQFLVSILAMPELRGKGSKGVTAMATDTVTRLRGVTNVRSM
jgi:hypothetical protein